MNNKTHTKIREHDLHACLYKTLCKNGRLQRTVINGHYKIKKNRFQKVKVLVLRDNNPWLVTS